MEGDITYFHAETGKELPKDCEYYFDNKGVWHSLQFGSTDSEGKHKRDGYSSPLGFNVKIHIETDVAGYPRKFKIK